MLRRVYHLAGDYVATLAAAFLRAACLHILTGKPHKPAAILSLALTAVSLCVSAPATDGVPGPCSPRLALSSDQVAQRLATQNAERAQHLQHFVSSRYYAFDYHGFPSEHKAEMQVSATYDFPGAKHFSVVSESGSKFVINQIFHRLLESEQESSADAKHREAVALTSANYRFVLRGCAAESGRDQYVMDVQPLREDKYLYRGSIWIDSLDFAVVRIEAEPARNPSFWIRHSRIHHQYRKVGEFYVSSLNRTLTETRWGGHSVLTIRYQHYRLVTSDGTQLAE